MSTSEVVNLRANGTDSANPAGGTLIGTATLTNLPDERFPDDESWLAPLISCDGRLFRFAKGSFAFGGVATPEYIEVTPVVAEAKFT